MTNIITPVKADILEELLIESNYDKVETQFLVEGFRHGFDIGYRGPEKRRDLSDNIPIRVGTKEDMWEKIMKEVKEKRFAGPFEEIPYQNFIQSPIGLVPKAGGKTRLIFHLSYQFRSKNGSLNENTPKEWCSVKYNDIDCAVTLSFLQGGATKQVFYAKMDISSAFRLVPLKSSCWNWLILKCVHPRMGKIVYFFDKCLPFGASISCSHFQRVSNGLRHIVEFKAGIPKSITNYLDDFLYIAFALRTCNFLTKTFMDVCFQLGIPVAAEKTVWGTRIIVFLGILLDGQFFRLSIPEEKRIKATNQLNKFVTRRKATVKEIQQLTGLLNFLTRAIYIGQTFTRRMYAKCSGKTNLKPYHHINLDPEFKEDCKVWLKFLEQNKITTVSRPYIDLKSVLEAKTLQFFSNASLKRTFGIGACYMKEWAYAQWPEGFIESKKPSIEYAELLGLVITVYIWSDKLANQRVQVFCDNQTVIVVVNNTTSSCKNCMVLVRKLVLRSLEYNFRLFATYVKSADNEIADSLSRLDFRRFDILAKKHRLQNTPELIPRELWPPTKIWVD